MSMDHQGNPYVLVEAVEALFSVDEVDMTSTEAAAGCLAALVRFLNHATLSWRSQLTLPFAGDIAGVIGSLTAASRGFPQLLTQLTDRIGELAEAPGLYTTAPSRGRVEGQLEMVVESLHEATERFSDAGAALSHAHHFMSAIGHADTDEPPS